MFGLNKKKMKEICTEIIWYGGKRNGKWIIPIVLDFDFTVTCKSSWLDGTFTENEGCFATLKKWTEEYNVMYVLDTMRGGEHIKPAVDYLVENGISILGVGRNPYQDSDGCFSTKCWGVFSIDDRNVGTPLIYPENGRPFVDWKKIDAMLTPTLQEIHDKLPIYEEEVLRNKAEVMAQSKASQN